MNTTKKGNRLEEKLFLYLKEQQDQGKLIYGSHPSHLCKIFKKKKYPCKVRGSDVEFDVVVEVYREDNNDPYFYLIFECKNQGRKLEAEKVNNFTANLGRLFPHASKGVIVTSNSLQSGAEAIAKNLKLGIVLFNEHGPEFIANRTSGAFIAGKVLSSQIFSSQFPTNSLKFSAFDDGIFFSSIGLFIQKSLPDLNDPTDANFRQSSERVKFISNTEIKEAAEAILRTIDYKKGCVDLSKICDKLSITIKKTEEIVYNPTGGVVLGSADFANRLIHIYKHDNLQRRRFTIAHELGHFCLRHDRYLQFDSILEQDVTEKVKSEIGRNYDRLEYQANAFASELLLPNNVFEVATGLLRQELGITNRGHGYIFVDKQPRNISDYNQLLQRLSQYFDVSAEAIEIKFKKLNMLTDQRNQFNSVYDALSIKD